MDGDQAAGAARPPAVPARVVEVVGGRGGTAAHFADLRSCAELLGGAAERLAAAATAGHLLLTDPDLAASAALAPLGAARVAGTVLAALDGPGGVAAGAARLGVLATGLVAAERRYVLADRLGDCAVDARRFVVGAAAVPAGAVLAGVLARSPLLRAATGSARGHAPGPAAAVLAARPGVVDEVVGGAPGAWAAAAWLLTGPAAMAGDALVRGTTDGVLLPRDVAEGAALLALLYPAARPRVTRLPARGPAATTTTTGPAPTGVADLLAGLAERDAAARRRSPGQVGVRRLRTTGPDGRVRTSWIVEIPGTRAWAPHPRTPRTHLCDVATNLETLGGVPSARVDGIGAALAAAGARSDEPVLLVGHSQGGLVALRAAHQWRASGRFAVTHVVVAGAPVGRVPTPRGVRVLALEDRADLVPRLDARDARDTPSWTTVVTDAPAGADRHGLEASYEPAAAAVDALARPGRYGAGAASVRDYLAGAAAFLQAAEEEVAVEVSAFDVSAEPAEPTDSG